MNDLVKKMMDDLAVDVREACLQSSVEPIVLVALAWKMYSKMDYWARAIPKQQNCAVPAVKTLQLLIFWQIEELQRWL